MSRVTLIGGHGKVALLAAPLLVDDGHEVISVVRNPDHVADVEATGATAAVVDVEHAGTDELAEALRGSERRRVVGRSRRRQPRADVCRRPRRRDPVDGGRRAGRASGATSW